MYFLLLLILVSFIYLNKIIVLTLLHNCFKNDIICFIFHFYNTEQIYYLITIESLQSCLQQKVKKNYFYSSSTLSMLVAYQLKTTYRVHGNVFGNAGGPCIIILTRGRNELFFRIIFKEKVIFCSLYFFCTVRCQ